MKTFVFSLLSLGALVAAGGSLVRGGDAPPLLRKGKVLILRNEYTIEGDIERVGERYCVRRNHGETWLPANRALALVASLPDAYAYLRKRMNLGDADERLRLARWCWTNGLHQQALTEAQAAADLRPTHAETRRLLMYWKQASMKDTTNAAKRIGSVSEGKTSVANASGSLPVANASGSLQKPAESAPIEVTTESLGRFATRVQPILMNTCARCHATGRGGNFHLTQVFDNSINNRRSLERNLAAVLAEVNVNQPEMSRLLIKAVSDHAHTGQAPLRDRQAAPYRTLESWVKMTVADNPHLSGKSGEATAHASTPSMDTKDSAKAPEQLRSNGGEESQWGADSRKHASLPATPARPNKAKTAPPPSSGTGASSVDPYDPEPFNRKLHPEASKEKKGN